MDDVYGMLVTIDYPDALTRGLRHATDTLHAVLERSARRCHHGAQPARLQRAIESASGASTD